MPARLYKHGAAVVHKRSAISVCNRYIGKRTQNVRLGYCRGGALEAFKLRRRLFPYTVEYFVLELNYAVLCVKDTLFYILQLLGYVPFSARQRLFSYVILRHLVKKRICNLYIVSEDLIVFDAQIFYSGALALPRLNFGKKVRPMLHNVAQLVNLAVVPILDKSTLTHGYGRLFGYSAVYKFCYIIEWVYIGAYFL